MELSSREPEYRTKGKSGTQISRLAEQIKARVRGAFKDRVVNYTKDIIIHGADVISLGPCSLSTHSMRSRLVYLTRVQWVTTRSTTRATWSTSLAACTSAARSNATPPQPGTLSRQHHTWPRRQPIIGPRRASLHAQRARCERIMCPPQTGCSLARRRSQVSLGSQERMPTCCYARVRAPRSCALAAVQ